MSKLRTLGIVMATLLAFLFANVMSGIALGLTPLPYALAVALQLSIGIAVAVGTWRFLAHASGDRTFVGFVLGSTLVLGGIGFAIGFLGPIILAPDANQGPLLGIFITGPLGVVVGAVVGMLRWRFRGNGERHS